MWTSRRTRSEAYWTWSSRDPTALSTVSRSIHRQSPTTDRCPASFRSLCQDLQSSPQGSFVAGRNSIAISSEQLFHQARSARTTSSTTVWTPNHFSSSMRIHFVINLTHSFPVTVSNRDLTLLLRGSTRHVVPWSVTFVVWSAATAGRGRRQTDSPGSLPCERNIIFSRPRRTSTGNARSLNKSLIRRNFGAPCRLFSVSLLILLLHHRSVHPSFSRFSVPKWKPFALRLRARHHLFSHQLTAIWTRLTSVTLMLSPESSRPLLQKAATWTRHPPSWSRNAWTSCFHSSRDCAMSQSRAAAYQHLKRQPWSHHVSRGPAWIQRRFKTTGRSRIFPSCLKSLRSSSWRSSLTTWPKTTCSQNINLVSVDTTPLRQRSSESSPTFTLPLTRTRSPFSPFSTSAPRSTLWTIASYLNAYPRHTGSPGQPSPGWSPTSLDAFRSSMLVDASLLPPWFILVSRRVQF